MSHIQYIRRLICEQTKKVHGSSIFDLERELTIRTLLQGQVNDHHILPRSRFPKEYHDAVGIDADWNIASSVLKNDHRDLHILFGNCFPWEMLALLEKHRCRGRRRRGEIGGHFFWIRGQPEKRAYAWRGLFGSTLQVDDARGVILNAWSLSRHGQQKWREFYRTMRENGDDVHAPAIAVSAS